MTKLTVAFRKFANVPNEEIVRLLRRKCGVKVKFHAFRHYIEWNTQLQAPATLPPTFHISSIQIFPHPKRYMHLFTPSKPHVEPIVMCLDFSWATKTTLGAIFNALSASFCITVH